MEMQSILSVGSIQARFLSQSKLLIWEEMPIAKKAAVGCADVFMSLLMNRDQLFVTGRNV